MNTLVGKITELIRYFSKPCRPPYDCPLCMHCYKNGGEIEDIRYDANTLDKEGQNGKD